MSSDLVAICDALAAVEVRFAADGLSYAITGTPLADVKDYIPTLPVRLILPPGSYGPGVSNYRASSFNSVTLTWNLVDMLLFENIGLGQAVGLKYQALAEYVAAYIPALNDVRKLAGKMITGITPNIGVIEYPRGSERFYNGVQMIVSVDETIC